MLVIAEIAPLAKGGPDPLAVGAERPVRQPQLIGQWCHLVGRREQLDAVEPVLGTEVNFELPFVEHRIVERHFEARAVQPVGEDTAEQEIKAALVRAALDLALG